MAKIRSLDDYSQYFLKDESSKSVYIHKSFIDRLAELKGRSLKQLLTLMFSDHTDDPRELARTQNAFERGKSIEHRENQKRYSKQNIPDNIRWQVWKRDNFTCRNCGSREYLQVDHIQPESKGGTLELSNLQTLCKSCNSRKGAR